LNRQLQVAANGITRFGLPIGELRGAVLPIPPLAVQRSISDFLDEKTAAIDGLIRKKERLIDLIAEKRQAAITRAVTKGLDPGVPMRDSGVEWIGEVPDYWRIFRMKHLGREPFQYGANEAGLSDDPEAPRFIRITDLRADGGLRDDTFKSLTEDVARPYLLTDGDILFARSGATVGKAVRYKAEWGRACFAGYLIRFRPDERIVSSAFIEYYTQSGSYRQEVGASTVQATIQNVSAQKYGEFRIAVPPLAEQARVVAELDLVNRRTRDVIRSLELHMGKLREYRQTLISAAVTGQIDVHSRVAPAGELLEEATV
jgi:type I restriction enzyme, S subunit